MTTAGAIEGSWQIATGQLASLSAQQFVDCSSSPRTNQGCHGGNFVYAAEYAVKNGICNEASYQYSAREGACQASTCRVVVPHRGILGYKTVDPKDERALMEAVGKQPVGCSISANSQVFQLYKGGVLSKQCGIQINHAVLIVGYGADRGQVYWLIKNSWGDKWGEGGYVRFARGIPGSGECGIKTYAQTYVVVDGSRAKPMNILPSLIAGAALAAVLIILLPACIFRPRLVSWWSRQRSHGRSPLLRVQAGQPRELAVASAHHPLARPSHSTDKAGNSRDSVLLNMRQSQQPSAPPANV